MVSTSGRPVTSAAVQPSSSWAAAFQPKMVSSAAMPTNASPEVSRTVCSWVRATASAASSALAVSLMVSESGRIGSARHSKGTVDPALLAVVLQALDEGVGDDRAMADQEDSLGGQDVVEDDHALF